MENGSGPIQMLKRCKKCGVSIVWNPEHHAETGKWVPFDEETDEPHDCPESDWRSGSGTGSITGSGGRIGGIDAIDAKSMSNAITNLEDKVEAMNKSLLKLILAVQTVQSRIEGQMPLFPETRNITAKYVSEPIQDPLDLTEEGV
jgi:hypothetical protein